MKKGVIFMKNLKVLRTKNKLSQQKLADILHVSQQSVYKYENNITTPDIDTLKQMADFFETSIDYLVGYTDIDHKIEPIYKESLNANERLLIEHYRHLTPKQRTLVQAITDSYLE